jgi:hypothetical protein
MYSIIEELIFKSFTMKTHIMSSFSSRVADQHYETIEWLKEAQFYLDEIEVFQRLIHNKQLPNHVGEQISRDVDLNLSTMADKIHKDVVRRLIDHESYLYTLDNAKVANIGQQFKEKHYAVAMIVKKLKVGINNLEGQVQKFMLQKEFGVRAST